MQSTPTPRAPPSSPQELEAGPDNARPHTPLGGYWCSAGHMQPAYPDQLAKRQEEARKAEEVQRMVEKRLQEIAEEKKKKKKNGRFASGGDIAANEGSLAGAGSFEEAGDDTGLEMRGLAALVLRRVWGGGGVGFDSAPIAGLTPEEMERRVDEARSWYVKADKDAGSNAVKGSGSIPNFPAAHLEDKARGGEQRQSLEAIIADVLRKATTAEYRLERARERIQELEQALADMEKEVTKCREEELGLAQRVSEIESRNRLMGEIVGGHAPRGFEREV
ncbi:uncharacterized protein H6S33_006518 [Morchella sextelata]|uniref:uncharacterized protein n=1 Tax=Morchella sextelata TaxID=1174677 RepID=UPI001D03B5BE|nr:uncharacterized protein H6S33_006518 [Morchella sextelata]KAH0604850.1 hypothetical protein H6S33_006518 [Morchella sextelata]